MQRALVIKGRLVGPKNVELDEPVAQMSGEVEVVPMRCLIGLLDDAARSAIRVDLGLPSLRTPLSSIYTARGHRRSPLMQYGQCKNCDTSYLVREGSPDTGFCSDLCFGQHSIKSRGTPLWRKLVPFVLLIGAGATWFFRLDLALYVADAFPAHADKAVRFLARSGTEGLTALLGLIVEGAGAKRTAAIGALRFVDDPAAARETVLARLPELDKLWLKLDRAEQGELSIGLGVCRIKEWKSRWLEQLTDSRWSLGAVQALGYLGDPEAVGPLCGAMPAVDAWSAGSAELTARVAEALGRIPDSEGTALPILIPLLKRTDPQIRQHAATAIGRLCSIKLDLENEMRNAMTGDRKAALKFKIAKLDDGLTALNEAGQSEKEAAVRRAMGEAAEQITRTSGPPWAK